MVTYRCVRTMQKFLELSRKYSYMELNLVMSKISVMKLYSRKLRNVGNICSSSYLAMTILAQLI